MFRFLLVCLLTLSVPLSTQAEERSATRPAFLGFGRLVVNDLIGDRYDRWRTGSAVASFVFGTGWTGQRPGGIGELLELRLMGEIIAPRRLDLNFAGDRPYAQSLSLGLHTHFERAGWQMALGGDAVFTGPRTHLMDFQHFAHRTARFDHRASAAVIAGQIPNGLHASGVFEMARSYAVGAVRLRPFGELRVGVEDLARVGLDLTLGPRGQGGLMVRDPVTGHLYEAVSQREPGISLVAGGDMTRVWDSLYLPVATTTLTETRYRIRAGVQVQRKRWSAFYGLTWLSPEFEAQTEGQVVGALQLRIHF